MRSILFVSLFGSGILIGFFFGSMSVRAQRKDFCFRSTTQNLSRPFFQSDIQNLSKSFGTSHEIEAGIGDARAHDISSSQTPGRATGRRLVDFWTGYNEAPGLDRWLPYAEVYERYLPRQPESGNVIKMLTAFLRPAALAHQADCDLH